MELKALIEFNIEQIFKTTHISYELDYKENTVRKNRFKLILPLFLLLEKLNGIVFLLHTFIILISLYVVFFISRFLKSNGFLIDLLYLYSVFNS